MKINTKGMRGRLTVFIHDVSWVPIAILVAYWLRLNLDLIPTRWFDGAVEFMVVATVLHGFTFWAFGCYRGIWRFASIPDLFRLGKAVLVGAVATIIVCFMLQRLWNVPRSVLILYPVLLLGFVSAMRVGYRAYKDRGLNLDSQDKTRALLVGAGRAGEMLVRDMVRNGDFYPVAFVDDDAEMRGHEVRGIRVLGTLADIPTLVQDLAVKSVLITMPSAPHKIMDQVVRACAELGVQCRTLPSLAELADGRVEVSRLRAVTVEDLLGREPVVFDRHAVHDFLRGKRVLVTGGGGSIGSELCRRIGQHEPGLLTILDNCEYNLYRIDRELSEKCPAVIFSSLLGDVRDERAVNNLFEQMKPQVIFHAAAYKHVPMVEDNIIEGIRNNVIGTRVVADAAIQHGVETFVLISTDKTVNPTNVMGTTKRVAELYCQGLNGSGSTHFITTRFGNVLASTGSVIPLFERQIAAGGPVTVTHPEITRYFMTIPEAATLILQASAVGTGGEIFVLDMGEPVRIADLAQKMIQLSGLQVGRDIEIAYTGLRPGEKLHEELFYSQEKLRPTVHPKLLLAECRPIEPGQLERGMESLSGAIGALDADRALRDLKAIVPEFNPNASQEERKRRRVRAAIRLVK
ncbi:MAG TPA: nucleoside-diphosphate sugar epimerase/dehydratase [Gammaproteobacteria bacterium]|nr:nucleoside-diphosphate sugar epimerase/dehydratase [Gammaproteobacteria bacterium]